MASVALSDTVSQQLYERALVRIPGGVSSPVRAMGAIGRAPIFIERGEGAELIDVDGNRYVDYVCSWGPLIHGHAHPRILAAIAQAAEKGTTFGAPTEAEVLLAEEIAARMPSAQMTRLTSSGTEASMTAIRLARAATSRTHIVKFAGAYHGHVDSLLAQAGSGIATAAAGRPQPSSPGVTEASTGETVVVPWNDEQALIDAVEALPPAAIIAEPLPANMGLVLPRPRFVALMRQLADDSGAVLILDEVISGFRVARGGAQALLQVTGDLTILGKVIGGGLPAAALAGKAELLSMLSPSGPVYQAGTLSGNPLATAAGLASLEMLDANAYQRLAKITDKLVTALVSAAAHAGVLAKVTTLDSSSLAHPSSERDPQAASHDPQAASHDHQAASHDPQAASDDHQAASDDHQAASHDHQAASVSDPSLDREAARAHSHDTHEPRDRSRLSGGGESAPTKGRAQLQIVSMPGLLTVFFDERQVKDFADAKSCDLHAHATWCKGLLARGVYPPPSQFEAWFPSLAHTDAQIAHTEEAAAAAFAEAFRKGV